MSSVIFFGDGGEGWGIVALNERFSAPARLHTLAVEPSTEKGERSESFRGVVGSSRMGVSIQTDAEHG